MHAEAVLVGKAELLVRAESELQGLKGQIERWRNEPGRGRAMPEPLWQEASAAAQKLGVYAVSHVLRLNYQGLKRRAHSNSKSESKGDSRAPASMRQAQFIDLSGIAGTAQVAQVAGAAPQAAGAEEAVVEVVATDGTRLTVRVKAGAANLVALVNAFRGRA
jgi:hypothetical protein